MWGVEARCPTEAAADPRVATTESSNKEMH